MPGLIAGDQYDDLTGAVQQVSSIPGCALLRASSYSQYNEMAESPRTHAQKPRGPRPSIREKWNKEAARWNTQC